MADSSLQPETFLRVKASKVSLLLDLTGELSLSALAVAHHPAMLGEDEIGMLLRMNFNSKVEVTD